MKKLPKDIDKYITPWLAAIRLINVAVETIACRPRGVRVKWELNVRFYYPPEALAKAKGPCVALGGKMSSGDEAPEITGVEPLGAK